MSTSPKCERCGRDGEAVPDGIRNEAWLYGHRWWCPACGQAVGCVWLNDFRRDDARSDVIFTKGYAKGRAETEARLAEENARLQRDFDAFRETSAELQRAAHAVYVDRERLREENASLKTDLENACVRELHTAQERDDLNVKLHHVEQENARLMEAVNSARESVNACGVLLARLGATGRLPTGAGRHLWDDAVGALNDAGEALGPVFSGSDERQRLEEENARLREALENLLDAGPFGPMEIEHELRRDGYAVLEPAPSAEKEFQKDMAELAIMRGQRKP